MANGRRKKDADTLLRVFLRNSISDNRHNKGLKPENEKGEANEKKQRSASLLLERKPYGKKTTRRTA